MSLPPGNSNNSVSTSLVTQLNTLTIVSGGQTGADRAALDFAIAHNLPHDGWVPRGRRAEDGFIDGRYTLRETPTFDYPQRTEWNIRDSDATVIFTLNAQPTGGTLLTIELAKQLGKPWLHLARASGRPVAGHAAALRGLIDVHQVARLNIAGPRASQAPEIAAFVTAVLTAALI